MMEEEEGPNWQQIEVGKTLMSMAAAPGSGSVSRQGTSCSILLPGGYLQFTAVFCLEGFIQTFRLFASLSWQTLGIGHFDPSLLKDRGDDQDEDLSQHLFMF